MQPTLRTLGLLAALAAPAIAQDDPRSGAEPREPEIAEAAAPKQTDATPARPLAIGKRLDGTTSLPDIDGNTFTAKDFLGNLTVVNFWSIRCPIMQAYEERVSAIQEDYAKKGVHFLHVNSNEANGEIADGTPADAKSKPYQKIRDYLADKKLDRRVLVDHQSTFADILGAKTTPDVFVFDKTGTLVYRGLIDTNYDGKQGDRTQHHLREVLDALLAGEQSPIQATMPHGCSIKRLAKPKTDASMPAKDAEAAPLKKAEPKGKLEPAGDKSKN